MALDITGAATIQCQAIGELAQIEIVDSDGNAKARLTGANGELVMIIVEALASGPQPGKLKIRIASESEDCK